MHNVRFVMFAFVSICVTDRCSTSLSIKFKFRYYILAGAVPIPYTGSTGTVRFVTFAFVSICVSGVFIICAELSVMRVEQ